MGEPVRILSDMSRPDTVPGRSAHTALDIGEPLRALMDAFVRSEGISRFAAWMAVWQVLLARLGSGGEVLLATPVSERSQPEWLDVIGMCLNTLPIRARVDEQASFRTFSRNSHRTLASDIAHVQLPYEDILRISDLDLGPDSRGLPQVMFVLHGEHERSVAEEEYERAAPKSRYAKNPLSIHLAEWNGIGQIKLEYDADRFHAETARGILQRFVDVARQVLAHPDIHIRDIDIHLPGERERIRELSGRDNTVAYPQTTLHAIFHETARLHPNRPAAIDADGRETSYGDLERQALQVAAYLKGLEIEPETVVAIHMQRSPALLASLHGILDAGGAFLLLEPSLPPDRLRAMLEQARVSVILTDEGLAAIPGYAEVTHPFPGIMAAQLPERFFDHGTGRPSSLAYVMFTSGSTGVPKGAMVEHGNIVNRLRHTRDVMGFGLDDRTLQKSPLSFDVCLTELLLPLFTGGAVAFAIPGSEADMRLIADQVVSLRATYLHFVPGVLHAFLQTPGIAKVNGILRMIRCGGESLPQEVMRTCLDTLDARLYQSYGPAETAVAVTLWKAYDGHGHTKPPIGRPNVNIDILIMDDRGRPLPPGMSGELWIGGAQTGRGYIHNEEETKRRFVDDPLEPGSGRRYYRTGDIARFLPDGNILFLGRMDDQVKVRGVRIELGDVSTGLLRCEGVCETVVLSESDGEGSQRLRAWVTLQQECTSGEAGIRSELADLLPTYMVPFRIHVVDAIPLTPHGKTDHRALRALAEKDAVDTHSYLPLENEMQRTLAALWSELLGVEVLHRDADFFRLGGHSLLALRMTARIHRDFGVIVPLADLFSDGRLEAIAARVDTTSAKSGDKGNSEIERTTPFRMSPNQDMESGIYPASHVQTVFWRSHLVTSGFRRNPQGLMLRLHGRLDVAALASALELLAASQPALRTVFFERDGDVYQ
jgi:amino acid adenylation domain-containing protein